MRNGLWFRIISFILAAVIVCHDAIFAASMLHPPSIFLPGEEGSSVDDGMGEEESLAREEVKETYRKARWPVYETVTLSVGPGEGSISDFDKLCKDILGALKAGRDEALDLGKEGERAFDKIKDYILEAVHISLGDERRAGDFGKKERGALKTEIISQLRRMLGDEELALKLFSASDSLFPKEKGPVMGINRDALIALNRFVDDKKILALLIAVEVIYSQVIRKAFWDDSGSEEERKCKEGLYEYLAEKAGIDYGEINYSLYFLRYFEDIFTKIPEDIEGIMKELNRGEMFKDKRLYNYILGLISKGVLPKNSIVISRYLALAKQYRSKAEHRILNPAFVMNLRGSVLRYFDADRDDLIAEAEDLIVLPCITVDKMRRLMAGRNVFSSNTELNIEEKNLLEEIIRCGGHYEDGRNHDIYIYEKGDKVYKVIIRHGVIVFASEIWPDEEYIGKLQRSGVLGEGVSMDKLKEYIRLSRIVRDSEYYYPVKLIRAPGQRIEFFFHGNIKIGEVKDVLVVPVGERFIDNGRDRSWGLKYIEGRDEWRELSWRQVVCFLEELFRSGDVYKMEEVSNKGALETIIVFKDSGCFYEVIIRHREGDAIKGAIVKEFHRVSRSKIDAREDAAAAGGERDLAGSM